KQVAEVHRAHEIAGLALKLEPAHRAVRMHGQATAPQRPAKNRPLPALRANGADDSRAGRRPAHFLGFLTGSGPTRSMVTLISLGGLTGWSPRTGTLSIFP